MSIKEHPPQVLKAPDEDTSSPKQPHIPVLLEATLDAMRPALGESYLDLTAGYGGHATAFLEATGTYRTSVLVDRDRYTAPFLENLTKLGVELRHEDFLSAARQLEKEGREFDLILADLGVSSPQLDRAERGFSFSRPAALDMRMDQTQEKTAAQIVNGYSQDDLADLIVRYGEEPRSVARRIAAAICTARPIQTTDELAGLIASVIRGPRGKIHPATRTFQALRIEVNDELRQIEEVLPILPRLLRRGGRLGIISFHSLEDRLVKRFFKQQQEAGYEAELEVATKKPISGAHDDVHNPRARSAKLRVAVKK